MPSSSFNEHYTLLNCLGKGAQGAVYRVLDTRDKKEYAAKRIPFAGITLDDLKKIEREATILQQLQHPHIPQFHEFYTEQDQWGHATVLVTELINGASLSQHLKTKKFSEPQLQSIKNQTLEALTVAHSAGIIHRDIKPANLMITEEDKIYLTDFGIAKQLGQETRLSSLGAGTLVYMSPEQIKGEPLTPASDQYSLALTLIALASGQERSDDYRHQDPLQQLKTLTHLSAQFRQSLEQLLEIDPRKRTINPSTQIIIAHQPLPIPKLSGPLETIRGNLRNAYKKLQPGTLCHVDELTTERRTNPDLRSQWFYTADGNVYSVDNGTPTLHITREAANPILNNIDDAFTQLTTNGNYKVLQVDFDAVKSAADTVTIDLTKLTLQGNDPEWCYIKIPTKTPSVMNKGYNKLNQEERKLAERVYGQGIDFVENMKMLKDVGITETRVYVLNPTYVQEKATESPVGRASWLNIFDSNSSFGAVDRNISDNNRVRGVHREEVARSASPSFLAKHKSKLVVTGLIAAAFSPILLAYKLINFDSNFLNKPQEVCSVTYNQYEARSPTTYVSKEVSKKEIKRLENDYTVSHLKVGHCYLKK